MINIPELIIENTTFSYYSHGHIGLCRIRIYQSETKYIIVASELSNNPGSSITNSASNLAREVLLSYPTLPNANEILFLEHYSARESYGHKSYKKDKHSFDRVTFSVSHAHDGALPFFTAAKWQRVSNGTNFSSQFLEILNNTNIVFSMIDS